MVLLLEVDKWKPLPGKVEPETKKTVSDVSHKVFDMDINKKNNLIFNGIVQEEGESKAFF